MGLDGVDWSKKIILLTCHRRENWGQPMERIFTAVRQVKEARPETEVIFPVHLNPRVRHLANSILGGMSDVHLIEPMDYQPFAQLMAKSYLVLTDSGGLQEESPALGAPVVVLRSETERPEAVESGTAVLAGTDRDEIVRIASGLLTDRAAYERMKKAVSPYGDGHASEKILSHLLSYFGVR